MPRSAELRCFCLKKLHVFALRTALLPCICAAIAPKLKRALRAGAQNMSQTEKAAAMRCCEES